MDYAKIRKASDMILKSNNTLVLTGAGISTESGIPDFRSPNSGLWEKIDPMEALSTDVLYNNPYKFYQEGYKLLLGMEGVDPNKAHIALARMEEKGLISGIITQNIDNLHQKAGSQKVLEVHGHIRTGSCVKCNSNYELRILTEQIEMGKVPPVCNQCQGILRPDVVMFGDQLPEDFSISWNLVQECDLLVVVGSSLSVAPVSYLPQLAPQVILINLGKTTYDSYADLVIHEKAGSALTEILKELL